MQFGIVSVRWSLGGLSGYLIGRRKDPILIYLGVED